MFLKYTFIFFAIMLAVLISIFKIFIQNKYRGEKIAPYVSTISGAFALYVITAILLGIFIQGNVNKFIVILFGLSPFIIGRFATYKHENFYSMLQIICAMISAGYVFIH